MEAILNQFSRNLMLWALIALALVMVFNVFQQPGMSSSKIPFTDFMAKVDDGQIVSVVMQGQSLTGKTADNHSIATYAPRDANLVNQLMEKKWKSGWSRLKNPLGT